MEFPSTQLRCSVHIDLYALERNLGRIRNFLPNAQSYIALVAADAFGIGIEAAVARLMLSGADAFAVTNLAEAKRVRRIGPGWPVIALSASLPGEEKTFLEHDIIPTISSLEEAERFCKMAADIGGIHTVHMKLPAAPHQVSTPDAAQAQKILDMLLNCKNLRLGAFCLSGAGTGVPEENALPDCAFLEFAREKTKGLDVYIHHGDIFDPASIPCTFKTSLRAGLVLFGVAPAASSILRDFKPESILTFRAAISHVKRLPKGAYVGYSKTCRVEKDSIIALLAAGYGDGLARNAGGRAKVIIRDTFAPLVGIVSMDQAAVDASAIAGITLNDEAIVIGASASCNISIEDYCGALGISPAEALTSITQRVPRFYTQSNV